MSIKFNDEHIPESPYVVPVIAPSDDARRLTVLSLQVRHKEASVPLATGQPVRPWSPEAASITPPMPRAPALLTPGIDCPVAVSCPGSEDGRWLRASRTSFGQQNTSMFGDKSVF